jgi:hypothetical protein
MNLLKLTVNKSTFIQWLFCGLDTCSSGIFSLYISSFLDRTAIVSSFFDATLLALTVAIVFLRFSTDGRHGILDGLGLGLHFALFLFATGTSLNRRIGL